MKKLVSLLFLAALACSAVVTSGCSKREQILAATSGLSGAAGGVLFLKGREDRNAVRKKKVTCLKYHNHGK